MSCPDEKSKQMGPRTRLASRQRLPASRPRGASVQDGQALVVVLLVSVIGLTIGLSLASRSTEETSMTTELEESSRAFSAAEAGLEESIQNIGKGQTSFSGSLGSGSDGGASYNVQVEIAAGEAKPFQFPGKVKSNQPLTVWLTGHNDDGSIDKSVQYGKDEGVNTITICWGEAGKDEAGLEVTLYYEKTNPIVLPTLPGGGSRGQTVFTLARSSYNNSVIDGANSPEIGSASCGGDFEYKADLNLERLSSKHQFSRVEGDTLLFMKLRPIILRDEDGDGQLDTRLAIDPGSAELPSQGEIHTSTGTTSGGRQTKIVQFISHPAPPELFDAVIYSEKELSK